MTRLDGERIYLRPMTEADATPLYASWLNDPEVNKYLATKSATVEELREYVADKNAKDDALLLGIFLKDGDRHVGTSKLEPLEKEKATIGVLIGEKSEWGKGYAGEAMRLLIDYCFKDLGLVEVTLGVLAQNEAAIKAYEKLGFKETGRQVGAVHYPNGVFDQVTMVLKK